MRSVTETQLPPPAGAASSELESGCFSLPLSFAQQRLWFIDQLHPKSPLYNVPSALRLRGNVDATALKQSLALIVERHEVLRTVYKVVNDSPVQEVTDAAFHELPLVDLTCLPAQERESNLLRHLRDELVRPFELSQDLMLRAAIFRLNSDEHVLFLNIHHIACDEWSMGLLFHELSVLYPAFCKGDASPLRELPIQYADFALWQHESMSGAVLEEQMQHWRRRLAGELPVLELPCDHSRPTKTTYQGGCAKRLLPPELSTALKTLSRDEGVTLFMLLLTAFKTLLHRYSGQDDIIVGTPVAGRNRIETEELIGFFVNTLALRTSLSPGITFRELLGRVQQEVLNGFSSVDVPFEKVVEQLQPERSSNQNPIFNVMFSLQNAPHDLRIAGLTISPVELDSSTAKFDLTLVAQDRLQGINLLLEYRTDLFQAATVDRMLGHLEVLLQAIAKAPEWLIAELPLLTDAEHRKIVIDWNRTSTAYPDKATVHQLFDAQARRTPEAVAVIYGSEALTYRELDERSSQLANHLRKFGVGPDVLVGICAERSVEMIVGWLGILKAGGAYVPLDPGYPAERLVFMLEDTGMPVLLTQKKLLGRLPKEAKKICLDADWKTIGRESRIAPAIDSGPDNLAYVIYTSGSTGKPKGVGVPHRAIARLVFNTNYVQLEPNDRIAQASNSSFDAATFEVWGALLHGAKLIGMKQDVLLSPRDFAEHLRENKVTTIFLTTALFNQIAADVPDAFCRVKYVLFGGEACDPRSVKEILTHGPPRHLLHVYGPTETTTFASWHEVRDVDDGVKTLPIGRPLSNTTFYVLDRNLQPVPVGVPGELYIGGPGVARGYWNRPEVTTARFIRNPFSTGVDDRLYRTGDLVRYLSNGDVEFIGRLDHQVKIRGFRIELEEIETILKQHESVRDALVLAREVAGGKQLVAYVVAAAKGQGEELRQHIQQKLPDFMVPAAFVFLDALPLTPNGKVDRRALPAPQGQSEAGHEHLPPRNNLENQLRKIWEQVLDNRSIGVRDNFFELGGHSLLAVRLFTQVEKKLGVKLPLSTLFHAPTIEQLAKIISTKSWSSPGASLVEIQPHGSRRPIFWLHTLGGGGGGGLFTYRKLAQFLGPNQPSYGLVTPPEPFTRIEDMAAHYISEMRTIQPTGPYYVGGYCFGGVIAFEIARQLEAKGMEVGQVILIESIPPNLASRRPWSLPLLWRAIRRLPAWTAHSLRNDPVQALPRLGRKLASIGNKFKRTIGARPEANGSTIIAEQLGEVIDFSKYPSDFKRYAEIHWNALGHYKPKPYLGKITLFRTPRPRLLDFDPEELWNKIAGGVDVKLVPGTHEKILEEPHVQVLAQQLSKSLGPDKVEVLRVKAA